MTSVHWRTLVCRVAGRPDGGHVGGAPGDVADPGPSERGFVQRCGPSPQWAVSIAWPPGGAVSGAVGTQSRAARRGSAAASCAAAWRGHRHALGPMEVRAPVSVTSWRRTRSVRRPMSQLLEPNSVVGQAVAAWRAWSSGMRRAHLTWCRHCPALSLVPEWRVSGGGRGRGDGSGARLHAPCPPHPRQLNRRQWRCRNRRLLPPVRGPSSIQTRRVAVRLGGPSRRQGATRPRRHPCARGNPIIAASMVEHRAERHHRT